MSLKQLQTFVATAIAVITLTGLAIKYGRDQEVANQRIDALERRIEVLEHIEVSEHPDYSLTIYWKAK